MNRIVTVLACALFALGGFVAGKRMTQKVLPELRVSGPTLAQQKMCSDQARLKYHEDNAHPGEFDSYSSHYDPKANVCYLMVSTMSAGQGSVSNSIVVYDAYEGRVYASYIWINAKGKKYWEVAPTECNIKPRGEAEITCSSGEEFKSQAEKYFGVAD